MFILLKMKKYLFICQHNFTRSKYSAEFFRGFLKGRKIEGKIYSAGLGIISIFLGRRINQKLIKKIDWFFVMEDYMKSYLIKKFNIDKKKIVVLNIKDIYGFFRRKTISDLSKLLEKKNLGRYL